MICSRCHRELKDPEAIAAGMGKICRRKSGRSGDDVTVPPLRIFFLSRREDGSRRWLVIDGSKFTVSVFGEGKQRKACCECGSDDTNPCRHIVAVMERDEQKI